MIRVHEQKDTSIIFGDLMRVDMFVRVRACVFNNGIAWAMMIDAEGDRPANHLTSDRAAGAAMEYLANIKAAAAFRIRRPQLSIRFKTGKARPGINTCYGTVYIRGSH